MGVGIPTLILNQMSVGSIPTLGTMKCTCGSVYFEIIGDVCVVSKVTFLDDGCVEDILDNDIEYDTGVYDAKVTCLVCHNTVRMDKVVLEF